MDDVLNRKGDSYICPAVAVVKDGKVLIGLRHYTPDKWKSISVWTWPGGRCDDGETIEVTLRREVKEETGIRAMNLTAYLGDVRGAKKGDVVPCFVAETDEEPKLLEPEKFSEWKWVTPEAFPKNFINEQAKERIIDFLDR